MTEAPTKMKDVPSNAVSSLKTKNAARLGASAVPMLQPRNPTAVTRVICAANTLALIRRVRICFLICFGQMSDEGGLPSFYRIPGSWVPRIWATSP